MKHSHNSKGFTLVEVIVVSVIVAILAAVAIPLYIGYINDAAVNSANNEATGFATAISNGINAGATAVAGFAASIDASAAPVTLTWTMPATFNGTAPTYIVQKGIKLNTTGTAIATGGTVYATVKGKTGNTVNW
jgi:prepilin-type N-terminal cleavage/methylation domain-containing protein